MLGQVNLGFTSIGQVYPGWTVQNVKQG